VWSCLAAVLGVLSCGLPLSLHAGSISAYRDANGRVVFVNENAPAEDASAVAPVSSAGSAAPQSSSLEAKPPAPGSQKQSIVAGTAPMVPASMWDELIENTANRHQVDPALVRAVVQVESNFDPFAVSSRGAKGLMQLVPATARRFGVRNAFDPKANVDGGVRYLKYLMKMFGGDVQLSLAAYNAGENAVVWHNGVPPFPETRDYLRKISEIYPLSLSPLRPSNANTGIAKFMDTNGIVHFSNMDMP